MLRVNIVPNIEVCRSINPKAYRAAIWSPPQLLQDLVNPILIHMIYPAMIQNTEGLTMWLKRHLAEAIAHHTYWPPPGSIWIHRLKHERAGGKFVKISMITTPTQWRLAAYFGYWTKPTGGATRRKRTQSTPIFPMWGGTYSLSNHLVSEWSPLFPLGEMQLAGGRQTHRLEPSQKCRRKAVFSSQNRQLGRWPRIIRDDKHRTRLGIEHSRGGHEVALNGQGPWLFGDVAGQPNRHAKQRGTCAQNRQMTAVG